MCSYLHSKSGVGAKLALFTCIYLFSWYYFGERRAGSGMGATERRRWISISLHSCGAGRSKVNFNCFVICTVYSSHSASSASGGNNEDKFSSVEDFVEKRWTARLVSVITNQQQYLVRRSRLHWTKLPIIEKLMCRYY